MIGFPTLQVRIKSKRAVRTADKIAVVINASPTPIRASKPSIEGMTREKGDVPERPSSRAQDKEVGVGFAPSKPIVSPIWPIKQNRP